MYIELKSIASKYCFYSEKNLLVLSFLEGQIHSCHLFETVGRVILDIKVREIFFWLIKEVQGFVLFSKGL